jgi:glycosyltransferase involved in cell wall biosynthesis
MDECLWIVIPAYNEASVIAETLTGLDSYMPRIVVVDDGSSDDTSERARAAGAQVLRHPVNVGQGGSIRTGMEFALRNGATHICTFDADGQHDVATIAVMMQALRDGEFEITLGSRFLGGTSGMPPLRHLTLQVGIVITRIHTGLQLTDTHNGLRIFTRHAAQQIRINQLGMAHASEILSEIARLGLRYVEIPTRVVYTEYTRRKGQRLGNSIKILTDLWYHSWVGLSGK